MFSSDFVKTIKLEEDYMYMFSMINDNFIPISTLKNCRFFPSSSSLIILLPLTLSCILETVAALCMIFQEKIAANITLEQGKTFEDAKGDVMRGLRKFILISYVW